jgi:hypothetical protein
VKPSGNLSKSDECPRLGRASTLHRERRVPRKENLDVMRAGRVPEARIVVHPAGAATVHRRGGCREAREPTV